jgi:Uma2 family endonuclease
MTVEQFEQLPEEEGDRCELKNGRLILRAHENVRHENAKSQILQTLVLHVIGHPTGWVFAGAAFALSPFSAYTPDVSFLNKESAVKADPNHIFRGAPDLAVEVVSESESAADLRDKIQKYLDAGTKAVWAVYPKQRLVAVYDHLGVRELRGNQTLEAPEILPGFQTTAAQFFE